MTLPQALDTFREVLLQDRRTRRTVENYLGTIRRLSRDVGELLAPTAEAALTEWRRRMQRRFERGEVSASTIRTDVAALRTFYRILNGAGLCDGNPAMAIRSISRKRGLPRPMPIPDLERLVSVIDIGSSEQPNPVGIRDRALVELYYNGLRNSEAGGLTTKSVRYAVEEQTFVLRFRGKGDREEEVVLSPAAAEYLAFHILLRFAPTDWTQLVGEQAADNAQAPLLAAQVVLEKRLTEETPLFLNGERAMTRREENRIFARYRTLAGLSTKYGPHSLRHTCATELLERGVDIRQVQEILRHRSIRSTEIYTRVRTGPKAAAMRKLPSSGRLPWLRSSSV